MFTGIIEEVGRLIRKEKDGKNLHLWLQAQFAHELKIDQSVSHDGICLTVVDINENIYKVTAIEETLEKTTLGGLNPMSEVNLERGMKLGDRLDGHIVQGHVDQKGVCLKKEARSGSWEFSFQYDPSLGNITIEKGSITINGVSLTVVESHNGSFSVAIIPYTYDNTTFRNLEQGSEVNLEFDVIGKYIRRFIQL